ncbi:Hsp33 family molecular chaperone HslO [Candidatus Nitrosacidococcus sp. I8]|uniref:Hsp33 family molecular chaperone HslO n=1 Tax=Candidatus Nitrosacidococcus sp. I8 TaxID=2942908 RepID=UPI002228058E|nr:Hsp33 family molecular chaperone HslO [Candidatus Nitrosacidococcus sp. I8]CAH9018041.1 33 kDa chaperonin [Candidatus Nitrosacidococcus sp. I8]
MTDQDLLYRFLFEEAEIRGEWVQLNTSWQTILSYNIYPPAIQTQLGQLLAAGVLLSATLKFKGTLIIQVQSTGSIKALVAQVSHQRAIRGLARWEGEISQQQSFSELYHSGRLTLTLQREGASPYQGTVPLEGESLAEALQSYFIRSEQLETRIWLESNEEKAAGFFLQELPSQQDHAVDWERVTLLANTITPKELLSLPCTELLYRLFHEEQVRLFDPEPVFFRCSCSKERIENTLVALGEKEVRLALAEQEKIEVTCGFCNRQYRFDSVDIAQLFSSEIKTPTSSTHH